MRKVADGLGIDLPTLFSAFALSEPGTDHELLAMARALSPHEICVLALLAEPLTDPSGMVRLLAQIVGDAGSIRRATKVIDLPRSTLAARVRQCRADGTWPV